MIQKLLLVYLIEKGLYKTWTLDWTGLDSGLDWTLDWTMDSQLFETIWALISAFLSDFGYLANQTLLLAHNTYI